MGPPPWPFPFVACPSQVLPPKWVGYHLECAVLTGARSAGSECLANTLAFTVVLWVIASTEHFPESLGAVGQLSQGPNKNKPFFPFNGIIVSGRGGSSLHFQFFKDCFVNLNDLFLPSLSLGSAQQSCSFKFKARFIWCFLPPPPLPVDRCVAFLLSPDFNPTPGTNFSISQVTEESIRSGSWFGGGRGMCAHHSREAMPAKQ